MILVDTSIWIDHLRSGDHRLISLLDNSRVLMHPFVLGELACGTLRRRRELLSLWQDLPGITAAQDDEVLYFIERHGLMGQGIGYVDAHLLAAVTLQTGSMLWTRDKRLRSVAHSLGVVYGRK